jgi:hypothetical protein
MNWENVYKNLLKLDSEKAQWLKEILEEENILIN